MDPAADHLRPVGRPVAGPQRGDRHRAVQRDGARDHPRGPRERGVHPAGDHRLRRLSRVASSRTRSRSAERETGVPADVIREAAHAYARADRAVICWTLGITEHHNAVDNVLVADQPGAAHRARGQVRVGGESAARPEQRAGRRRHGGHPEPPGRLPGLDQGCRPSGREFERAWGVTLKPQYGWNLTEMFEAMEHGELTRALRHRREPGPGGGRPAPDRAICCKGLDHLVVQDIFLTATAQFAHVVLPASSSWCEAEGTVTNSERRVQRVRKALEPPGQRPGRHLDHRRARQAARDTTGATRAAEDVWNEVRRLAPIFAGMSYERLEREGGLHWPCYDEQPSGRAVPPQPALEGSRRGPAGAVLGRRARPAGRAAGRGVPLPAHDRPAARLVQHRRADRRLHLAAAARARRSTSRRRTPSGWASSNGDPVRVTSRRGSVVAPARIDRSLRAGLVFMTLHFQDEVERQPAHHRRDRSQVRHGRVQGLRRSGGAGAGLRAACPRRPPVAVGQGALVGSSSARRRARPTRSARRSTRCSALPPPGGTAARGTSGGMRTPRRAATRPGPAGTCCLPALQAVQSRDRLDQRRRAQLRLRAALGPAGRCLRRGHVLRPALDRAAAPARAPRLRRHRLPVQGRRRSCAPSSSARSARPVTTAPTAITSRSARTTRSGCGARASACATRRRPRW